MSVEENLELGAYLRKDKEYPKISKRFMRLFPRLLERRKQSSGTLSGGEQQMLAMGRAIMAKPKLLLLDEPSMGLAPLMVKTIFQIIKKSIVKEQQSCLLNKMPTWPYPSPIVHMSLKQAVLWFQVLLENYKQARKLRSLLRWTLIKRKIAQAESICIFGCFLCATIVTLGLFEVRIYDTLTSVMVIFNSQRNGVDYRVM